MGLGVIIINMYFFNTDIRYHYVCWPCLQWIGFCNNRQKTTVKAAVVQTSNVLEHPDHSLKNMQFQIPATVTWEKSDAKALW